jgi:hypothetical protein
MVFSIKGVPNERSNIELKNQLSENIMTEAEEGISIQFNEVN